MRVIRCDRLEVRDWVLKPSIGISRSITHRRAAAGDMLPNATRSKIASGFHRNTMINMEGGVDAEETRIESVVDAPTRQRRFGWVRLWRVPNAITTSTIRCRRRTTIDSWPSSITRSTGRSDEKPEIEALTLAELSSGCNQGGDCQAGDHSQHTTPQLDEAQRTWNVTWRRDRWNGSYSTERSLVSRRRTLKVLPDSSILAEGPNENDSYTIVAQTDLKAITGMRIQVISDPTLPSSGPGRDAGGTSSSAALRHRFRRRVLRRPFSR
jgi:hypothetical protein